MKVQSIFTPDKAMRDVVSLVSATGRIVACVLTVVNGNANIV